LVKLFRNEPLVVAKSPTAMPRSAEWQQKDNKKPADVAIWRVFL